MRFAIGCDHAGLSLKATLAERLQQRGHTVQDLGTDGPASCDYADFAEAVARAVSHGQADQGLLVCLDTFSARMIRQHNDANVLCLGERVVGAGLALDILDAWLDASFEGGRHQRRVDKITALEASASRSHE